MKIVVTLADTNTTKVDPLVVREMVSRILTHVEGQVAGTGAWLRLEKLEVLPR